MRWIAVLIVGTVLLTACPKNEEVGPAEVSVTASTQTPATSEQSPAPTEEEEPEDIDLSGTWSGTWANVTPDQSTGTFELEWEQSITTLEGTISITGTPCLTGGGVSGTIHGQDITFGAVQGEVSVAYEGSVNGDGTAMSGTYSTDCGNASGSWEATKSD